MTGERAELFVRDLTAYERMLLHVICIRLLLLPDRTRRWHE